MKAIPSPGLLAWLIFAFGVSTASAETLEEVLAKHAVPRSVVAARDRSKPITSYAASKGDSPFLLAYYDDDGSGLLKSPLHILRYDRSTGPRRIDLAGTFGPFSGIMHELNSLCLGSALAIQQVAGFVYIDTHINPSAGCVLVLSFDLRFKAGLEGWMIGAVGRFVILHGNEVHFADTHPSTVTVYDPQSDTLTEIYPVKDDPRRQKFSAALASRMPSEKWCREENKACDPTTFTSDISELDVDEKGQRFSFTATLSPEGFGDKAEHEVDSVAVPYTFKMSGGKWVATEPAAK